MAEASRLDLCALHTEMSDIERHVPGPRFTEVTAYNGIIYLAGQVRLVPLHTHTFTDEG